MRRNGCDHNRLRPRHLDRGDVRSELFHYEVRVTYDTPEIAEHRRIVQDAQKPDETKWQPSEWKPDDHEKPEW